MRHALGQSASMSINLEICGDHDEWDGRIDIRMQYKRG